MNIVTPIPTSLVFTTANVNTESARRDNLLRETIPQTSESDQSSAEQGLGGESDRVRTPGQPPAPLTYERPQVNAELAAQNGQDDLPDNGQDESAGRQGAEQEQQQQAEQREIEELERRDAEVRAHEQAHAATGGQYASAPQYEFETGPDGRRYAVGGQVSIDISEESTPEQTIRKMQQVRAAALAPVEPSPQDLQVAAEATQKAFEARVELAEDNRETLQATQEESSPLDPDLPELDDIIDAGEISPPSRTLDQATLAQTNEETDNGDDDTQFVGPRRRLDIEEDPRIGIIQQFYQDVSTPRNAGFSASA